MKLSELEKRKDNENRNEKYMWGKFRPQERIRNLKNKWSENAVQTDWTGEA